MPQTKMVNELSPVTAVSAKSTTSLVFVMPPWIGKYAPPPCDPPPRPPPAATACACLPPAT